MSSGQQAPQPAECGKRIRLFPRAHAAQHGHGDCIPSFIVHLVAEIPVAFWYGRQMQRVENAYRCKQPAVHEHSIRYSVLTMIELTLDEFIEARRESIVVDVLPHSSFRAGHIPDAVNMPLDEVGELAASLIPPDASSVILYCAGPQCPMAERAAELLSRLGYRGLKHFGGGLEEWTASGNTLEREFTTPRTVDAPTEQVLHLIDRISLRYWVMAWFGIIAVCALAYWSAARLGVSTLMQHGQVVASESIRFLDCLYFSLITATTLGYGDITPVGWARLLAAGEAMSGMILGGALISKLLSSHQERLLQETHDLTFMERLGRIQTSLHLLISEYQSIVETYSQSPNSKSNLDLRFLSAKMLLLRDLRVVRDLLHDPHHRADESVLEAILVTLAATLRAFLAAEAASGSHLVQHSEAISEVLDEICADCVPHEYSKSLKHWMDHIHEISSDIRDTRKRGGSQSAPAQ